jgi:hypothetical protein
MLSKVIQKVQKLFCHSVTFTKNGFGKDITVLDKSTRASSFMSRRGNGVDSASNKNEYQKIFLGSKEWPVHN